MRGVALFLGILCGSFAGVYIWQTNTRLEVLASENKELRLRGAARDRVKAFKTGEVLVNIQTAYNAGAHLGTPPLLLEAVRKQENGSPLWEYGHQGKTEWIALGIAPEEWQAHECARTLNKAAWKWILADKTRTREALKSIAKDYTAAHHAKQWAVNVDKIMETK